MRLTPQRKVFSLVLIVCAVMFGAWVPVGKAAPQSRAAGQGSVKHDDPCDHLPDPPGNANGIAKNCPLPGSSSGVAKGDFNGDGFADLAIGEPRASVSGVAGAGDVIVIYGSAFGLTTTTSGVPGRQLWYEGRLPGTPEVGDHFGSSLASGDFNGDGFSDLAIGIPDKSVTTVEALFFSTVHPRAGVVVVVYGSDSGLSTTNALVRPQSLTMNTIDRDCAGGAYVLDDAHFGQSLARGNFNGDKANGHDVADLAVGIPGTNCNGFPGQTATGSGAVFVFMGAGGGVLSGRLTRIDEERYLGLDSFTSDGLGSALTAGDFNADGFSDLVVASPGRSVDRKNAGTVFVLPGDAFALAAHGFQTWTPDLLVGSPQDDEAFGLALATGDFNGDGKSDLAIGIPRKDIGQLSDAGVVTVLYGASDGSGLSAVDNQLWSLTELGNASHRDEAAAQFGKALAAGDFNGDGRADLAIGVPFKDISVSRSGAATVLRDAGEVDVIYGSSSGLSTTQIRTVQFWNQDLAIAAGTAQTANRFGLSLTAWNFGRNELAQFCNPLCFPLSFPSADLAIGVPFETVAGVNDAGAVDVMYGSFAGVGNGLRSTGSVVFTADNLGLGGISGARFGAALY